MTFIEWLKANDFIAEEGEESQLTEKALGKLKAQYESEEKSKPKARVEDVIADAKKEEHRRERIADLTAQFLSDYAGRDPELVQKVEALANLAVEANWSEEKYDTELLRASRPTPTVNFGSTRQRRLDNRVIEAAIAQAGRLEDHEKAFNDQTLQMAHDQFKGRIGLRQLFLIAAEANGYRGSYASDVNLEVQRAAFGMTSPVSVRAQGFSTISISTILSNNANKFLMQGWNAIDMSPMEIAAIRNVRDFKEITTVSLTGNLDFEKIGPDGEIPHGVLSEVTYGNKADTYAKMLAITRQDIINDDLSALTDVPMKLGRGAANTLNDLFWTEFLILVSDGFFSSGNNNINEGIATMTFDGLDATETIFMNQTNPEDGSPLLVQPAILVVPTALKNRAIALMSDEQRIITGANTTIPDVNVFSGRFRVVSSPSISNAKYTGNTSVGWWMLADPMELPVMQIAALNGRVEPVVETADADFNVLGVQMRGYSDVGVRRQEFRGGVFADGGAS